MMCADHLGVAHNKGRTRSAAGWQPEALVGPERQPGLGPYPCTHFIGEETEV